VLSDRCMNAVSRCAVLATAAVALVAVAVVLLRAGPAAASSPGLTVRALGTSTVRRDVAVVPDVRVCRRQPKKRAKRAAKKTARRGCRRIVSRARRAGDHAVSGGLIVGLNADVSGWGGASTAPYLGQIVSRTGARWLRERFLWSTIEPSPGLFTFAYYDHFMLLAARRGERILALLGSTPAWAGPSLTAIPTDPSPYAAYVAAVVRRYGPHGSFWKEHPALRPSAIKTFELWNEPYYDNGNNGTYDPPRYARLVKAAGIAGHAADSSAKLLLSAEMQSARDPDGQWVWWTDALYRAVPDLNNYFDGVAIHDYGSDTTSLNPMVAGQAYTNYGHVRRAENLRRQFVSHGAANKPFWITEAGWSTCTEASSDCVAASQQAGNLTTLLGYVRNGWKSWVQAVFVYRYADGADPTTVQEGYGLVNRDGTPKPALSVFRTAAATTALGS
jgi:hypothetical protein